MKKIIRLTESDLTRIVKLVLKEEGGNPAEKTGGLGDNATINGCSINQSSKQRQLEETFTQPFDGGCYREQLVVTWPTNAISNFRKNGWNVQLRMGLDGSYILSVFIDSKKERLISLIEDTNYYDQAEATNVPSGSRVDLGTLDGKNISVYGAGGVDNVVYMKSYDKNQTPDYDLDELLGDLENIA